MKKRNIGIVLAVCLILAIVVFLCSGLLDGIRVYQMLSAFWSAERASMDVELESGEGGMIQFQADWLDVEGRRIIRLQHNGVAVYYCDGVIYLENGKGYDFRDGLPDVSQPLEKPWRLLPLVQIDHEDTAWTVQLTSEELIPQIQDVNLILQEDTSGLETLQFCVRETDNAADTTSGMLTVRRDRAAMEVPGAVLDAMQSGTVQGGTDLTRNVLRLLGGWAELSTREPLAMTLGLWADCGVFALDDELTLYRTAANGTPISYVEKNGHGLYFTDKTVCTADGTVLTSQESAVDAAQLLGFAYSLCFNGELSFEGDVFRLTLDREGMEAVAYAVAPQVEQMNVEFTSGTMELTMQENSIAHVRLTCGGSVDLVLTQMEVSIGADLEFLEEETNFVVPEQVLQALIG